MLTYSIDNRDSFLSLPNWYKEIQETSHRDVVIWVVATKLDLEDLRQVSKAEGEDWAKSIHAGGFVEVSSKTGENVK